MCAPPEQHPPGGRAALPTLVQHAFARLGLSTPQPPPLSLPDEEAFQLYARLLTARNARAAAVFLVLVNLLCWPGDRWIFAGLPGVAAVYVSIRLHCMASAACAYLLLRSASLSARPLLVAVALPAYQCAMIGHSYRQLGGLDQPWFHFTYLSIICVVLVIETLPWRALYTLTFPVLLSAGFAWPPAPLWRQPMLPPTLVFLGFMTLVGLSVGHMFYLLVRQNFFQARAQARTSLVLQDLNETLEDRVREQTGELRRLAAHLETAREAERTHLSRELHDELGQELTALRYAFDLARQRFDKSPHSAGKNLDQLGALLAHTTATVRHIVSELRPRILDEVGLGAAVRWLVARTGEKAGLACRLAMPDGEPELGGEVAIAAFRILQESLTNVVRHAGATSVAVELALREGRLLLRVEDDGTGLQQDAARSRGPGGGGMGLLGMRERAEALGGWLRVERGPLGGVLVAAALPVAAEARPEPAP